MRDMNFSSLMFFMFLLSNFPLQPILLILLILSKFR
jgi:hypothetical protein